MVSHHFGFWIGIPTRQSKLHSEIDYVLAKPLKSTPGFRNSSNLSQNASQTVTDWVDCEKYTRRSGREKPQYKHQHIESVSVSKSQI